MVDLNYTILFTAIDGHMPPPQRLFTNHLYAKYDGSQANWSSISVNDWTTQDDLEGDSSYWETHLSLTILPWQTQTRSDPLPLSNRVLLTVHNFSLDYWHPPILGK